MKKVVKCYSTCTLRKDKLNLSLPWVFLTYFPELPEEFFKGMGYMILILGSILKLEAKMTLL